MDRKINTAAPGVNKSDAAAPGVIWDESANQWLASCRRNGREILHEHFPLVNDAIAAVRKARSGELGL